MKNNVKTNTVKQILARVMIAILLFTSVLNLSGCMLGGVPSDWEVYSHQEFVKRIEKFNSINNGSVDTFISFDLDNNENVINSIYYFWITLTEEFGLYDIHDKFYDVKQIYYLGGYKIKCNYKRIKNNFTQDDKIEIRFNESHHNKSSHNPQCQFASNDSYYEGSLEHRDGYTEHKIYNYFYYYEIYVNDSEIACIHISSRYESNEEELNEIIKMLEDSLVVINT